MNNQPLVSVVIPTHNYGLYIEETLNSLLKQTHSQWECIIIDDGSTDSTRDIVSKYILNDTRFQYHYQNCQGVSAARNAGLAKAMGDYIQFLDADDILLDKKLEVHVAFLTENQVADIVYSDVRYFLTGNSDELSYSLDMKNIKWLPEINYKLETGMVYLAENNIMPIQAPLSRAVLLRKVGLFDINMRYCEDWDYWFRCVAVGGVIHYLQDQTAMSLVRVHNTSASQNSEALAKGASQMHWKVFNFIERNPSVLNSSQIANIRRLRALEFTKRKQYAKGLILYFRTLNKTNNSKVSLSDVLYWIKKTL